MIYAFWLNKLFIWNFPNDLCGTTAKKKKAGDDKGFMMSSACFGSRLTKLNCDYENKDLKLDVWKPPKQSKVLVGLGMCMEHVPSWSDGWGKPKRTHSTPVHQR